MKYMISTTVYDNGDLSVSKPLACDDNTRNASREFFNRDVYIDVFDTWEDAWAFYMESKNA